ncbi:MAG: glutamyl-tRNA reductase [Actinomycetota bacterium]
MPVLVTGLNYKGTPLELLERFSFEVAELPKALLAARASEHIREAVILSTCNRTEVYAVVDAYHGGVGALRQFLSEFHHVAPEDFSDRLYGLYEDEAVAHLFSVASGIDSMVIGEPQILTQVRRSFRTADEEGTVSSTLSALFRQAIRVGRRARAETGIARSASTLAMAGATLARNELGSLDGRSVLVVGAGKMSDLAAVAIAQEGANVLVANRTASRAHAVAERAGGRAVAMGELGAALAESDLVLASTGASQPLITKEMVATAMAGRARPLILLDLAVPRDVEHDADDVPGVTLKDMDDLREAVAPDVEHLHEVDRVRRIIAEEVPKFLAWQRTHSLAPLLEALQQRVENVRISELKRAASLLADLDDRERAAVETLTRSMLSKLLHDPVKALKEHAGTAQGEVLARALRMLYALPDEQAE